MARMNCYGQPGTRGPRRVSFAELVRPAASAGLPALQAYLWKAATAPDADAATRNAAAAEHRAVTQLIRNAKGI